MEIWKQSSLLESSGRHIAAQVQSRIQVTEIPFQEAGSLGRVDFGEMLITVLRGEGVVRTGNSQDELVSGDQVYLLQGDEFSLSAATKGASFVVQMYWAPEIRLDSQGQNW